MARSAVDAAYAFLTLHLLPHAAAENEVLYPAVGRALGSPVVRLHVAKEEELYVPALDESLSAGAATALFGAMHQAALDAAGGADGRRGAA